VGRVCGTYRGQETYIHGVGAENKGERDSLEDVHVNGRIILEWIFKNSVGKAWTGLIWLR
jgi:hypothetical protein